MPISLPQRPSMGAVILPAVFYDKAKALGIDMAGYIRGAPMPVVQVTERERRAARKKLADWAKRGGK